MTPPGRMDRPVEDLTADGYWTGSDVVSPVFGVAQRRPWWLGGFTASSRGDDGSS